MYGESTVPVISSVGYKREEARGTSALNDAILPVISSVGNKREELTGTLAQNDAILPVISSVENEREELTGTQLFWLYTRSTELFINDAIILLILS